MNTILLIISIITFPLFFISKRMFWGLIWFPLFIYSLGSALYKIKLFAYYADYITNAFPILFEFLCLTLLVGIYKVLQYKISAKLPQIIKPFGVWIGILLIIEIIILDLAGYNIFYSNYYPSSYFASQPNRFLVWLITGCGLGVLLLISHKYKQLSLSTYALLAIFIYAIIANILPNSIILYTILGAVLSLFLLFILLFYARASQKTKLFKFTIFLILFRVALFFL